jgi:hypothetical protein
MFCSQLGCLLPDQSPIGITHPTIKEMLFAATAARPPFYAHADGAGKELKKELDMFHSVIVNYNSRHGSSELTNQLPPEQRRNELLKENET